MKYNSTTQPIAWFRDKYRNGQLNLSKPYQRKPVWVARQKCWLIETILLRFPIPEIFVEVHTSEDGEQEWGVIDGQQRIRAILQFMGTELEASEQQYNGFVLDKLEDDVKWYNKSFDALSSEEKTQFFQTRLAVRELEPGGDSEVRDMFKRLNRYLTPLNPQELRKATYFGPFARLAEELANNEYWVDNKIVSPAQIRRMKDVQFVSELLIGAMHGPQAGDSSTIDEYYAQYEDYDDEFPAQREVRKRFESVVAIVEQVLPDLRDTRWSNQTDFYTLFVALAGLLRTSLPPSPTSSELRRQLDGFADQIARRLADERAEVRGEAIDYVRAVEKGVNDKKRRADRQAALLAVIQDCFKPKTRKV